MDTSQWAQVSLACNINNTTRPPQQLVERNTRPLQEQALNCPRCNSTNTKFCYYNNYSLNQPRYFCKACKRYWTQGGSLRNVPVGGGSRKNKKRSSSIFNSSSPSSMIIDLHPNPNPIIIPPPITSSLVKPNQVQDLNMNLIGTINSNNHFGGELSAMELLRSTSAGAMYGGGFGLYDFSSPSSINGIQENGGMLLFPFGDHLKELSHVKSRNESDQQNIEQGGSPPTFWSTSTNFGGSDHGSW